MFTFHPHDLWRQVIICHDEQYGFELSCLSFENGIDEAKTIFLALRQRRVSKVPLSDEEDADLTCCLCVARDWLLDRGFIEQG